jgi:hypothetical protein
LPSWFAKWLRQHFPDRRAVWNDDLLVWQIQHNERIGVMDRWVVELTWPHREIQGQLCDKIAKGAWFSRGVRFKDYWRDEIMAPDIAAQAAKKKNLLSTERDWRQEGVKAVRRDTGKSVMVGAVKNERIGNKKAKDIYT